MRPDGPRDPVAGPDSGPQPPFPVRLSGPVIRGFGRGSKELGIPTANIPPAGLAAYPDLSTGVYYGFVGLSVPQSFLNGPTSSSSSSSSSPSTTSSRETTTTTDSSSNTPRPHLLPAVLSIGYNPFYSNKTRSIEIHILPSLAAPSPSNSSSASDPAPPPPSQPAPKSIFKHDFYGSPLNLLILGFIRPEYDYVSLEALVEDIRIDCEVATRSLARPAYRKYIAAAAADGDGGGNDGAGPEEKTWLQDFTWVKRDPGTGEVLFEDELGKEKGAEVQE